MFFSTGKKANLHITLYLKLYQEEKEGFTLLELMVVMMIISVLTAIAIPAFYGQIGKSREAELQMKMGAIARSQQSYHFQQGQFASTMNTLNLSDGLITSFYYDFPDPTVDTAKVKHQALAKNSSKDQTRNYAIGIYFDGGAYGRSTCRAAQIGEAVNVGDLPFDDCTNNGTKVQ
jgi:type IV pilus assembly protein PilA